MKIYLCGPMTLNVAPNLNRDAFAEATERLTASGHDVFNPGDNPADLDYAACMRIDIQEVLDADAVVVLPRWMEGVGTRVEVAVALAVGTPVYEFIEGGTSSVMVPLYSADAGRPALRALLDGDAA